MNTSIGRKLLFVLLILAGNSLIAQESISVLGSVKDFNEKPVADANVYIDGVNTFLKTNARGYFQTDVDADARVVSVYKESYGLLSAIYTGQDHLNFVFLNDTLSPSDISEGKEIYIGYGEVDEEQSAYSATVLEAEKTGPVNKAIYSIYDLISSRVPGVRVTGNNQIIVRGIGNLRGASNPLLVVNGQIVTSLDFLSPSEVDSIEFLKDAAAAIYGSQGANGVLLIKLKS